MKAEQAIINVSETSWYRRTKEALRRLSRGLVELNFQQNPGRNDKVVYVVSLNNGKLGLRAVCTAPMASNGIELECMFKIEGNFRAGEIPLGHKWRMETIDSTVVAGQTEFNRIDYTLSLKEAEDAITLTELLFWRVKRVTRGFLLEPDQPLDYVEQAEAYMRKNFHKELHLKDVADAVHISPYHLSHQFKKVVGYGFVDVLNMIRIEKAKDLLKDTDLTVGDVAFETGFNSASHFNRIFKQREEVTPGTYRKKNQ